MYGIYLKCIGFRLYCLVLFQTYCKRFIPRNSVSNIFMQNFENKKMEIFFFDTDGTPPSSLYATFKRGGYSEVGGVISNCIVIIYRKSFLRYCVLIQLHSITIVHTQQCRISLYHFEALSHKRIGFGITLVKLLSVLEISVSLARVSNDAFPTICLNRPILVLIRHGWGYCGGERYKSFPSVLYTIVSVILL